MDTKNIITVRTTVKQPIEKVWTYWKEPQHISKWYAASEDWHAPAAENDLTPGGKFKTTMAAKDGSFSFDFSGKYLEVEPQKLIKYTIDDDRKVEIFFNDLGDSVEITETFEPEQTNSSDMQRGGWQAILDNFKKYTENN